jgi:hypothetical protein
MARPYQSYHFPRQSTIHYDFIAQAAAARVRRRDLRGSREGEGLYGSSWPQSDTALPMTTMGIV